MKKTIFAISLGIAGALGFVGVAGATPPTAAEQVGGMATTAAGELTPIILAVGAALVTVAVVRFGVRWVLSATGRGGR